MSNYRLNVIVLVGFPASGKTTWANTYYYNFARIDGDFMKTSKRVVRAMKDHLMQNRNVVIDATNLTLERRKDIIVEAKKFNAMIHAVIFRVPIKTCMERAKIREQQGGTHIPNVAFYSLNSSYVEPSIGEGFDTINSIDATAC